MPLEAPISRVAARGCDSAASLSPCVRFKFWACRFYSFSCFVAVWRLSLLRCCLTGLGWFQAGESPGADRCAAVGYRKAPTASRPGGAGGSSSNGEPLQVGEDFLFVQPRPPHHAGTQHNDIQVPLFNCRLAMNAAWQGCASCVVVYYGGKSSCFSVPLAARRRGFAGPPECSTYPACSDLCLVRASCELTGQLVMITEQEKSPGSSPAARTWSAWGTYVGPYVASGGRVVNSFIEVTVRRTSASQVVACLLNLLARHLA
jgi:hypothetical protein